MKDSQERNTLRMILFNEAGGYCANCGQKLSFTEFQLAHRIANTIENRKIYGDAVIDHKLNLAVTHAGACNDAMNIGYNPEKSRTLAEKIKEEIEKPRLDLF